MLSETLIQRIVGALVIIALGVIIIPVLHTRGRESAVAQIVMPKEPTMPMVAVPSIDQAPVIKQAELKPVFDHPLAKKSKPELKKNVQHRQIKPRTLAHQQAQKHTKQKREQPKKIARHLRWAVQLASFVTEKNAKILQKRLVRKGYPAIIRTGKNSHGRMISRILVGEKVKRAQAVALKQQLQHQVKLKGIVVQL